MVSNTINSAPQLSLPVIASSLPPTRELPQTHASGAKVAPLAKLPAIRTILHSSANAAACSLAKQLQDAQEQLEKGSIDSVQHAARCEKILAAAQMLHGAAKVEQSVLEQLDLGAMTPEKNALSNEEYAAVQDDVALQRDAQQNIQALRNKQSQGANAAARGRRNLQNMLPPAASAVPMAPTPVPTPVPTKRSRMAIPIKVMASLSDAAASGLSYSAAVLSSKNLYIRSMTSSIAWTVSAAFDGIDHGVLAEERSTMDLLSDTANFGAGALSITATGLSHASNFSQTAVNTAAISSNTFWAVAGGLTALSGIRKGYGMISQSGASTLTYTASALQFASGVANAAAAGTSIRSTVTSNGNDADLNRLAASFWMAGTAFGAASAIIGEMAAKRQQNHDQLHSGVGDSAV